MSRSERNKRYRAKHRERLRAYDRERSTNPDRAERRRACDRAAAADPEKATQIKARNRAWREANPEVWKRLSRRAAKAWAQRNPEHSKWAHIRRRFGLSRDEWQKLFDAQGRRCACCGTDDFSRGKGVCVDHDHVTGRIRGLVCHNCNIGLGALGDNIAGVTRAVEYLEPSAVVVDEHY